MASYEVDEIILEGWFKKHSAKGKSMKAAMGKKAKRRWFCLTERYLDYYTAPRTKRKGTIPVDQLYVRRHDPYTLVVGCYGGKEMKITYDGSNNPAGKTDEWYQGIQDASEAAKIKYGQGSKKKASNNQSASGNASGTQASGDGALVEYVAPEQLEEGVIKCGKCANEIEVDPGTGPIVRCPYCHTVVSALTGIPVPPDGQQQQQSGVVRSRAPQQAPPQQAPPPQQQQYNQPPPQQQQYQPQQQQYAPQQQIVPQQPMATQVYQQPAQQVVYQQPAPAPVMYQSPQPVVHTQRVVQAGMPPVYAAPAVTTTTYVSNQPQVIVQPAVQAYGTTTIVQQPTYPTTSTTYTYY